MADSDLFTFEQSHGKPRLTQPRPSDLGSVEAGDDRQRNHNADGTFAARNRAGANRNAKRAVTAPLRAARKRLQELGEGVEPSAADTLQTDAMAVYGSARLELGSSSIFVLANLVTFATEAVLAGYFSKRAGELGFDTEEGASMLEVSHRCETQSQRAMTAALAATKALGGKKKRKKAPSYLVTSVEDV